MEQLALSFITGGNAKWYRHFVRQFGISYKANHILTDDPAVVPLGIYPNELKINAQTKTFSQAG